MSGKSLAVVSSVMRMGLTMCRSRGGSGTGSRGSIRRSRDSGTLISARPSSCCAGASVRLFTGMHRLITPLLLAAILLPLGGQDDAPSRPGYFTRNLYPVMEKAGCRGCHNVDGVSSATPLHFPDEDAAPARIEAFGKSLV